MEILLTNDDGYAAPGLLSLISALSQFGKITVVAPKTPQSGRGHAITTNRPLRLEKQTLRDSPSVSYYHCDGTPADCVKIALNQVMEKKPDLLVSGINHGTNASINVLYSGTMGAVLEGCINQVPSIGFSLDDFSPEADFSPVLSYCKQLVESVYKKGLPPRTCLNVNFPKGEIKGLQVARQSMGRWNETFIERFDPIRKPYFWLGGSYENTEEDATDTDQYLMNLGYASVVPVTIDLTNHQSLSYIHTLL